MTDIQKRAGLMADQITGMLESREKLALAAKKSPEALRAAEDVASINYNNVLNNFTANETLHGKEFKTVLTEKLGVAMAEKPAAMAAFAREGVHQELAQVLNPEIAGTVHAAHAKALETATKAAEVVGKAAEKTAADTVTKAGKEIEATSKKMSGTKKLIFGGIGAAVVALGAVMFMGKGKSHAEAQDNRRNNPLNEAMARS